MSTQKYTEGPYTYEIRNNKAYMTAYTGPWGSISIPSTLGGYPVIYFRLRETYTIIHVTIPIPSVKIPRSVSAIDIVSLSLCLYIKSINVDPANQCYTSINGVLFNKQRTTIIWCPNGYSGPYSIPDSVTTIGDTAFSGCSALTSITSPDCVKTIGSFAFDKCSSLVSVTIGDSVTSIGDFAFHQCTSLKSVTIPDSVTAIGGGAFSGCRSLTSVTIPNSVISIGDSAFSGSCSLTSITIPNNVTTIGNRAFSACKSLATINVATNNPNYASVNGVLFNKDRTTIIECPTGSSGHFTIPDNVTAIGDSAFSGCSALTSVTIPDSVTSIGTKAFYFCPKLNSVNISDSKRQLFDNSLKPLIEPLPDFNVTFVDSDVWARSNGRIF